MSICFGCGSKFGFFKKEYACSVCCRLHCHKCLREDILLSSGKVKKEVCRRCFDAHKKADKKNPNDKHLAKDPVKNVVLPETPPPYSLQHSANIVPKTTLREGGINASDPDAEIRQRLEKLKKQDIHEATCDNSEKSVHEQFRNLTGRDPLGTTKSNILSPQQKLTEQEEIAQLMESAIAEAKLDNNYTDIDIGAGNATQNLEDRLLKLKGIDPKSVKEAGVRYEDDSSDEEGAAARVLKKAFAEARIDDKVMADGYGPLIERHVEKHDLGLPTAPSTLPGSIQHLLAKYDDTDEEDELPWCCICNENATLRCHGCDDDLYCRRCFREGHSRFDVDEHKTSPFRKKTK